MSRRYVSYWNAILFFAKFPLLQVYQTRPDKVNPQLFLHDIICSNSLLGTISKDYIRVHPDAPYYQIQSTDTDLPIHYAQIKVLGCYHYRICYNAC